MNYVTKEKDGGGMKLLRCVGVLGRVTGTHVRQFSMSFDLANSDLVTKMKIFL